MHSFLMLAFSASGRKERQKMATRQANYNKRRMHYANEDCTEYTYIFEDGTKLILRAGEEGVTQEMIIALDAEDVEHDECDVNFYRLVDKRFQGIDPCEEPDDMLNPWSTLREKEPVEESWRVKKLRIMIEEDLTENQQDLFFRHFGMSEYLEDIRAKEIAKTGRTVSHQALTNRKNKIIDKGAKCLGVERIKRRNVA